jgi:DNA-binding transcriptional LysR family regulator
MTPRQLERFLAVDDLRSFRKAAERIALSRLALSWPIKELPRDLGLCVFDRLGRAIEPTLRRGPRTRSGRLAWGRPRRSTRRCRMTA